MAYKENDTKYRGIRNDKLMSLKASIATRSDEGWRCHAAPLEDMQQFEDLVGRRIASTSQALMSVVI
jgi:hypothetical protein